MRTSAIVATMVLGACGRMGFDELPAPPDTASVVESDAAPDALTYRATAVSFESAAGDYLWTGSLANTTNAPRGTYSAWFHFTGRDNQQQLVSVAQVIFIGGVIREASNRIHFLLPDCTGITVLDMQTTGAYTTTSGWVHVLASWDLPAGRAQIYINDVADRAANPFMLSGNVCYASLKWGIGGLIGGALDADVADFYASLGTSLDLDIEANRRKFIDAAGKPVDLGTNCNTPTGITPTGCFVGDAETWATNKGLGAGMNVDGDGLALAPTSPSD